MTSDASKTFPIAPNGTVGILGGGQLGRMLALAAARLGLRVHIYADSPDGPAEQCAAAVTVGDYRDAATLEAFAKAVDVVTYEFENVPAETVEILEKAGVSAAPGARPLAVAQDRLAEKDFMRSLGAGVAPYAAVDDVDNLAAAASKIGLPAILKTRRFGYDGKGQVRLDETADASAFEAALQSIAGAPAILEGFVPFACEISVVGARGRDGASVLFDPARNDHAGGILRRSRVPADAPTASLDAAREITLKALDALDYVGVLAVEFFVLPDGAVLVNEFAPRVHNSGHWTQDACVCDQFEQHIRAVCGWPLGDGARHSDADMANLIGDDVHSWRALAATPDTAVHLYGKSEARDGRKMGHATRIFAIEEGADTTFNTRPA
ncbi:MAG: 5-(carboxyamino)imidazole ribonucleotide synthase [Pseudomonadota bacterium]